MTNYEHKRGLNSQDEFLRLAKETGNDPLEIWKKAKSLRDIHTKGANVMKGLLYQCVMDQTAGLMELEGMVLPADDLPRVDP